MRQKEKEKKWLTIFQNKKGIKQPKQENYKRDQT